MRRRASIAWLELGYAGPDEVALNLEVELARQRSRRERAQRQAAVPAQRRVAKEYFARLRATLDADGEV